MKAALCRFMPVSIAVMLLISACTSGGSNSCTVNSDCPDNEICTANRVCVSGNANGDTTSDQTGDQQTGDQTQPGPDTNAPPKCQSHEECGGDEFCSALGKCLKKAKSGEPCGAVIKDSDRNNACRSGVCYSDAYNPGAWYCAAAKEDCVVEAKSVASGTIICDEKGSGFKTCLGSGVWSELTACAPGEQACYAFEPDKDVKYTGLSEAQTCKNGEGCVPNPPVCTGCTGYFAVDPDSGKCLTSCLDSLNQDDDSKCWSIAKCIGGACLPTQLRVHGAECQVGGQCKSNFCVRTVDDNGEIAPKFVCCEEKCDKPCHYCNSQGQCRPLSLNAKNKGRFDALCPINDKSTCGTTGRCGKDGNCENWSVTTECRASKCESDVATLPAYCDGIGNCPTVQTRNCQNGCDTGGLICAGTGSCTSHGECGVDEFCGKDGSCHKKRKNFESCSDLVYDQTDLNGACESGQCTADPFDTTVTPICTEAGKCNRFGVLYDTDSTLCLDDDFVITCKGAKGWEKTKQCEGKVCDLDDSPGKGYIKKHCSIVTGCNESCEPCEGSLNATELGCPTICQIDSDCYGTHFCDSSGACQPRAKQGETCQNADGTRSCIEGLHCVESEDEAVKICCPVDCDGVCNYCGVTLKEEDGNFINVYECKLRNTGYSDPTCKLPQDVKIHPDCSSYTCTGEKDKACVFPVGSSCGDGSTCKDGLLQTFTCQEDGTCKALKEKCPSGECKDKTSCKPLCSTHAECPGLKPTLCTRDGDNKTNLCFCAVDGFCRQRLADGKSCEAVSKPKIGLPDSDVCRIGSKCIQDNLSYVTPNINNSKGNWFCAKENWCVDQNENNSVNLYADGDVLCASEEGADGTDWWTCDKGSWTPADKPCATKKFPACEAGTLGPASGYRQSLCQSGPASSATSGCQLSDCISCGGFRKDPDESKKCVSKNCAVYTSFCLIIIPTLSSDSNGPAVTDLQQYITMPMGGIIILPKFWCEYDSYCLPSHYCVKSTTDGSKSGDDDYCYADKRGLSSCTRDGQCKSNDCGDDKRCDCANNSHCYAWEFCNQSTSKCTALIK